MRAPAHTGQAARGSARRAGQRYATSPPKDRPAGGSYLPRGAAQHRSSQAPPPRDPDAPDESQDAPGRCHRLWRNKRTATLLTGLCTVIGTRPYNYPSLRYWWRVRWESFSLKACTTSTLARAEHPPHPTRTTFLSCLSGSELRTHDNIILIVKEIPPGSACRDIFRPLCKPLILLATRSGFQKRVRTRGSFRWRSARRQRTHRAAADRALRPDR